MTRRFGIGHAQLVAREQAARRALTDERLSRDAGGDVSGLAAGRGGVGIGVGTRSDDPFRARLGDLVSTRDRLLHRHEFCAREATDELSRNERHRLLDELRTLQESLNVLKLMRDASGGAAAPVVFGATSATGAATQQRPRVELVRAMPLPDPLPRSKFDPSRF